MSRYDLSKLLPDPNAAERKRLLALACAKPDLPSLDDILTITFENIVPAEQAAPELPWNVIVLDEDVAVALLSLENRTLVNAEVNRLLRVALGEVSRN